MNRYGWLAVGAGLGLMLGTPAGFMAGVASTKFGQEFLEDMVMTERPANVKEPKTFSNKFVTFRYPGNWKLDTKDLDYNPDYYFSLDTPGASSILFYLFDEPMDVKEDVKELEDSYTQSVITRHTRHPFQKWGNFNGYGVELKGRVMRINRGGATIFAHSGKDGAFQVTELYYDEDRHMVRPGFELIRSTFRFHPKPEKSGNPKPNSEKAG